MGWAGHRGPHGHRKDTEFTEVEMRNHRSVLIREDHDPIYTLGRFLQLPLGRQIPGEESRGRETTLQMKMSAPRTGVLRVQMARGGQNQAVPEVASHRSVHSRQDSTGVKITDGV